MQQHNRPAPDLKHVTPQTAKPKAKALLRAVLHPHVTRGLIALGVIGMVVLGCYIRLIVGPLQVPFLNDTISNLVEANLPAGYTAQYQVEGVMMENGVRPMVVIAPFSITETDSGAVVSIDAVRVAFAPFQALFGRPAADLILEHPHVQAVQDFRGVRLATLQFDTNAAGTSMVRIQASESDPGPMVIHGSGIEIGGDVTPTLVSDNDWIVVLVNEMESLLAQTDNRFEQSELRLIEIRGASLELLDQVYRTYRHFEDVDLLVRPLGDDVRINLGTEVGQRLTTAEIDYRRDDLTSSITGHFSNIDLAVFLPLLDDEEGIFAVKGGSELDMALDFEAGTGVTNGRFVTDITGTTLEIQTDSYPISGEPTVVDWSPSISTFTLEPARLTVGNSSATVEGRFALGVDESFGPTAGIYFKATDILLNPDDLPTTSAPIEMAELRGWSAPVYGAVGIDSIIMQAGDMQMSGSGRLDFLQRGIGINLDINMTGASVDQVKRVWPYFIGRDIRELFVQNVKSGTIDEANLSFDLDPGVVDIDGFVTNSVPPGGAFIDAVTSDIELAALEGGVSLDIEGKTRVRIEDNAVTLTLDKAALRSGSNTIQLADLAYYNTEMLAVPQHFEVSGEATGDVAQLTAIANQEPFLLLEGIELGITPADLRGEARVTVIAQVTQDPSGKLIGTDYTLNGTISNFASSAPIEGRTISDGTLNLVASQAGYKVTGNARIDGVPTDLEIETAPGGEMQLTAAAVLDAEARKALGYDFEQYIGGTVRFVSRPESDSVLQIAVDLKDASLDIDDLGVHKPVGEPGTVTAAVSQKDGVTSIDRLDLSFGTVHLQGSMEVGDEEGLRAASFSTFQLNPDDKAALAVEPIEGGYRVRISGEQLDLKPVLSRFLGLSDESAQARSSADTKGKLIELQLDLERALGFYSTTAFNAHFNMAMLGNKLLRADAQAQLGGDKSMSITTNSLPAGRVMSVAVNDIGTLLRFIGSYSRILGGEGSLVMTTDDPTQSDRGEFVIRDFAIIDEDVVAQILGNHQNSRDLIARQNRVDFTHGRAVFVRAGDHLTVTDAALHGDRIGGTLRGTIYTKERRYDLVGTYVPLFGLNNMFQQLPLVGRIVGGREGEGLIGVTFKVEGPLDHPQFRINPASILAPGVLRQLFEFRAEDAPPEGAGAGG